MTVSTTQQRSPTDVVQAQLDAYNAHDLDVFCGCFAEDIEIFRMPAATPDLVGLDALRRFYAEHRFNRPALHSDVLNRIAIGDKVIDHERIAGLADTPVEVVAVYRVVDDRIATVWFFYP
jgi:hypothetical protein